MVQIVAQTAIPAQPTFHWLDWSILGLFAFGMILTLVWSFRKKEESATDYFLAGKSARWLSIGSSIFASNIGSEHLVGLAGAGFVSGMAMAHWEMHGWLILTLGWVFVPFYDRIKVFTMPEFLERRFSPGSRSLLSIISLVSYVFTKVAVTVYAGGVVFGTVFGIQELWGIDFFWVSAVGLVVLTGIYTVLGGMNAVMYTAVLQTPVLLIGSIAILVIGLIKAGGWGDVAEAVGGNIKLVRPASDPMFPWTGVLLASPIIGFWYWCTDQYIVQRVLSGRDQKEARRGAIFAGYLKLLPVFIFLVPGMIAFALSKKGLLNVSSSDAAFSCMVAQLLPAGFKGVVVCGLLAALMSSLASLFNSSAALFVGDFYTKLDPGASQHRLVFVGRAATATVVVLGVLWIPIMKSMSGVLYEYLQEVQGLLAPAIAAAFILGVFWRRTNAAGGLWGLGTGFVLGMFRLGLIIYYRAELDPLKKLIKELGTSAAEPYHPLRAELVEQHGFLFWVASVNWLHYTVFLFVTSIAVTVLFSFIGKPSTPEQQRYTYGGATAAEKAATRASWNVWDLVNTAIALGVIILFYSYFW